MGLMLYGGILFGKIWGSGKIEQREQKNTNRQDVRRRGGSGIEVDGKRANIIRKGYRWIGG
jgi:hypothetical protein